MPSTGRKTPSPNVLRVALFAMPHLNRFLIHEAMKSCDGILRKAAVGIPRNGGIRSELSGNGLRLTDAGRDICIGRPKRENVNISK